MSDLGSAVDEYLTIRRALGFGMRQAGKLLPDFASFLQREGAPFITTKLALKWATQPSGCHPGRYAARLHIIRPFARYQHATDPRTEIPPKGLLPRRYRRGKPYIYRDDEVLRLMKAAEQVRSPKGLWGATHSTLFGLLAVTGMRIGESVALDREDVDLKDGILTIRQAKFGKSRLLPIHASTARRLREYAALRNRVCPHPDSRSFFLSESGRRMTAKFVGKVFLRVARRAGLRGPNGRVGPRLHDLRHTFSVRTLLIWCRAGADIDRHIPTLSTYLGHGRVADTYWYISATPELLRLSAMHAERNMEDHNDEDPR